MPELPEVECITLRARRHLIERRIKGVRVIRGKYLQGQVDLLVDRYFKEVYRRGKYVLFELMDVDERPAGWMQCHNAMSGYWDYKHDPWTFDYVEGKRVSRDSDVRVEIDLDPAGEVLRFHDTRLFGRIEWTQDLPVLGPDALRTDRLLPGSQVMTRPGFQKLMRLVDMPLKPALMSQNYIAGVGNIYAAEACGWAGIRPDRPCSSLLREESGFLFDVLQELLAHNVPEIRYNWLRFYRKKVCHECKNGIVVIEQAGRKTWYCEHCQR